MAAAAAAQAAAANDADQAVPAQPAAAEADGQQQSSNAAPLYAQLPTHLIARLRDISRQAVWTLSSCKQGFGVQQLLDANPELYWQSDGSQPHWVNIHFSKRTPIHTVAVYTDATLDESYTPSLVAVRVGTHEHDLEDIVQTEIAGGKGWTLIQLATDTEPPPRVFLVQVAILANRMNGRDTHLRALKVLAPEPPLSSPAAPQPFTDLAFQQFSTIR